MRACFPMLWTWQMWQMYLDNGVYGGARYLDSTILMARRMPILFAGDSEIGVGLVLINPLEGHRAAQPVLVSIIAVSSYGFTGTIAWADPKEELVYVFCRIAFILLPRIKAHYENVRTNIMQIIYDAIIASSNNNMLGIRRSRF